MADADPVPTPDPTPAPTPLPAQGDFDALKAQLADLRSRLDAKDAAAVTVKKRGDLSGTIAEAFGFTD